MKDKKYYMGLDIGVASVGWASTDVDYKVLNLKGKRAIGVRLFDEASTAVDRRVKRGSRRRVERRRARLKLLEELFAAEISKVDMGFFKRLEESKYWLEDKTVDTKYILFNDKNYTDQDFYAKYPTIYHLRKDLFTKENPDIREVYLACHHIIKYRGNFLFEGENFSGSGSLLELLRNLRKEINFNDNVALVLEDDVNLEKIESILLNREQNKSDKVKTIKNSISKEKQLEAFFKLVVGLKTNLSDLYENNDYKEEDKNSITFGGKPFEEERSEYETILRDDISLVDIAKKLYDAIILNSIKEVGLTISESKVKQYNQHKEDLMLLKKLISEDPKLTDKQKKELYNLAFRDNVKDNYVAYSGRNTLSKGGSGEITKRANYDDFKKFINNNILAKLENNEVIEGVKKKLELDDFLLLQRVRTNGVIPYQIHKDEVVRILENASRYYPSLLEKTEGYSVVEKIIMLLEFRIPYYVGPLNNYHKDRGGNAWIVRKNKGKITPWNYENMVDEEESANNFIRKMTNKCTYLAGKDVIPKNSLLYSEYTLLNELNNLNIGGEKISVAVRNDIIETFFKTKVQKVTKKMLEKYLRSLKILPAGKELAGVDTILAGNLKSYVETKSILGDKFQPEMVEKIIEWLTLFGNTKKLVRKKIKDSYGEILSNDEIKKLSNLNYKDWGRFSRELLTEIKSKRYVDTSTGELFNIINAMRNNVLNFMELMSEEIGYSSEIDNYNKDVRKEVARLDYSILDDIYVSPSVKRAVWQALKIVDEVRAIVGHDPEKIFIETVRSNKQEKKRTKSRKQQLEELFKSLKDDKEFWEYVKNKFPEETLFKTKKLWLYCTQLGKCMYSGDKISLDDLFSSNSKYDIDHIYPRSKTKDDSLHANLVLAKKELNAKKDNKYPLIKAFDSIPPEVKEHWKTLLDKKLITEEKYKRLTRTIELSSEELARFVARQLVETSQSTKAVAGVLKNILPNTAICYVKAENVSEFRRDFTYEVYYDEESKKQKSRVIRPEFIKIRELNNYHHAHDAYLNIVVGNVFDVKFTRSPANFIKNRDFNYSLNKMYDRDIKRGSVVAWEVDKTLETVRAEIVNKRVLVSRKAQEQKGSLYDATVYNKLKAKNDVYMALKTKDEKLRDVTKYGGMTKIKSAYYSIVRYELITKKDTKLLTRVIDIPIYLANTITSDEDIANYFVNNLNIKSTEQVSNVSILYRKLPQGSSLKIDGYHYYIRGKSEDTFCLDGAVEVLIAEEYNKLLKDIVKYTDEKTSKINNKEITMEMNKELYNYLVGKMNTGIFVNRKRNKYSDLISDNIKSEFESLTLEKQCVQILEILNLLTNKNTELKISFLSTKTSRLRLNFNITNLKEFKIIEKSVTGLREKVVTII